MKAYLFRCNGCPRRVRLSNPRRKRQQSSGSCCFRRVLSPDPGKWWGQMPEQKPQSESLSGALIQSSEGPRLGHSEAFCKTHLLSSLCRLHVGMIFLFFPFFWTTDHGERERPMCLNIQAYWSFSQHSSTTCCWKGYSCCSSTAGWRSPCGSACLYSLNIPLNGILVQLL